LSKESHQHKRKQCVIVCEIGTGVRILVKSLQSGSQSIHCSTKLTMKYTELMHSMIT